MKCLIFTALFFVSMITAQDSISSEVKNQSPVVIRCGSSIVTSAPLIILDGVPFPYEKLSKIKPKSISSIVVLKNEEAFACYGIVAKNGVILVTTTKAAYNQRFRTDYPFKMYTFHDFSEKWNSQGDILNTLLKVPGLRLEDVNVSVGISKITMRGDDNTILIINGVQQNTAMLNSINPNDIQSIRVAPSAAATNYFANNFK